MSNFRWSFSQWETYNACPAKWRYKSVLKLPGSGPGPAASRGLTIHASVEDYIANRSQVVHKAVDEKYLPIFDQFRDHPNGERHLEYKMSLTKDWRCGTDIAKDDTWCLMVLDAVRVGGPWYGPDKGNGPNVAYVGEWKSGKPKDTHSEQRKLYALGALLKWDFVDEVHVTTYYLEDTGKPQRLKVAASGVSTLKTLWLGRVDQMQKDKILAPKPGVHCNWCDYAKKKGGPCVFGG